MNDLICKAIQESQMLSVAYKGALRWIEPHAYGLQANGKEGLCGWQLGGGSGEGFRLYLVSEMQSITLGDAFNGPPPRIPTRRQKIRAHIRGIVKARGSTPHGAAKSENAIGHRSKISKNNIRPGIGLSH